MSRSEIERLQQLLHQQTEATTSAAEEANSSIQLETGQQATQLIPDAGQRPESQAQNTQNLYQRLVLIALVTAALGTGTAIGWAQLRAEQLQKVEQAASLLSNCQNANSLDRKALEAARTSWQRADAVLQSIPPIPSLGYVKARSLSDQVAACKTNLDINTRFVEATTSGEKTRDLMNTNPALSEFQWQQAVSKLNEVIKDLQFVESQSKSPFRSDQPQQNSVIKKAATELASYQTLRESAQQKLQTERSATANFNQAEALYQQAAETPVEPSLTTLEETRSKLKQAIDLLGSVPEEGTTVSKKALQQQNIYSNALLKVESAIATQHMQILASNFNRFADDLLTGVDLSSYVEELASLEEQVRQIEQWPEVSSHPAFRHFKDALADYRTTYALQSVCYNSNEHCYQAPRTKELFLIDSSKFFNFVIDNYGMKAVFTADGKRGIKHSLALSTVLQHARNDIRAAEQHIQSGQQL